MKREKKNSFTDALDKELSSRKIFTKAAKSRKKSEDEIFVAEVDEEKEIIAEPIDPIAFYQAQVEPLDEAPKKKSKKNSAKKNPQKNSSSPQKNSSPLKPESDFEERIFAEAENDFFDEKPLQSVNEKSARKKSSFRSKILKEELKSKTPVKDETPPDYDPELYRKLSRAELAGVALSAIMMLYSFVNLDKPLFFLALSLFTHLIRPFVGAFCGKYNRAVQNGLRSFSLALFVGALVLLFTNS